MNSLVEPATDRLCICDAPITRRPNHRRRYVEAAHCFGAETNLAKGAYGRREGFWRASPATGVMCSLDKFRLAVPQSERPGREEMLEGTTPPRWFAPCLRCHGAGARARKVFLASGSGHRSPWSRNLDPCSDEEASPFAVSTRTEEHVRYLGIDVHSSASVWCLLDERGEQVARGRIETNCNRLKALAIELSADEPLIAGHEVGTQVYLVHDAFTDAGVDIRAFNAAHLRMIAASRKKTDKRDAYWIARSLQTGMTPHPVHIPRGEVRELRRLLAQRGALVEDRKRWQLRARAHLRARGIVVTRGKEHIQRQIAWMTEHPEGVEPSLLSALGMCERAMELLDEELVHLDGVLVDRTRDNAIIQRLRTIPGIGKLVAIHIYAAIDDIRRFPNASSLSSYAGLVPSIRQTGMTAHYGKITKEGSPELRRVLVQAAHAVAQSNRPTTAPLRVFFERIYRNRGRKKVATVALAHLLLKISFRVWRDGTNYDPTRLRCFTSE
jgi:transposase